MPEQCPCYIKEGKLNSTNPSSECFLSQNKYLCFLRKEYLFSILCVISGLLFFFELGGRSFELRDVPRYAEMAREMLHSGSWMVTQFHGHIYMSKPPMLMWLIAIFSSVGHQVTPLTARLPNALGGFAGVLMTYYFTQKFSTKRIAFLSAVILTTCQKYFWHGREARTDMLFTVFVMFALYFFYLGYREKRGFYIGFYLSLVFATLTKGPLGIIFAFSIIATYLALQRDLKSFKTMQWHWGAVIFVSLVGAWVTIFCLKVGIKPLMFTVKNEFLTRVNKPISHAEPFYYYFVKIWTDFAPWSLLIPFACIYAYKKWREGNSHLTFISCWLVVIFVFLFAAKAKCTRYMIPLFPALSILVANLINETYENIILSPRWLTSITRWIVLILAIIAAVAAVAVPSYFLKPLWIGIIISILILVILIKLFLHFRKKNQLLKVSIAFIILITSAGWMIYIDQLTKESNRRSFGPALVSTIKEETTAWDGYTIRGYKIDRSVWNIINMNLNMPIPRIESLEELRQFLNSTDTKSICIMEKIVFDKIKEDVLNNEIKTIDIYAKKHPLVVLTRK